MLLTAASFFHLASRDAQLDLHAMPVSKLTFQASSLSLKLLQIHIQIEKNLNQKQKIEAFQFFLGPDTKILSCFLIFVPLDVFSLECCLLHNIHLCPWTGMVI